MISFKYQIAGTSTVIDTSVKSREGFEAVAELLTLSGHRVFAVILGC